MVLSGCLLVSQVLFAVTAVAPSVPLALQSAAPTPLPTATKEDTNSQPAAPANGTLTADHPVYTLQLNSNPTTGYSWFLVSYPNNLLSISKHEYVAPQTNMPGAGGYEIWQFTASAEAFVAPRVIKIEMLYARPWEINDQSTKQSFYVVTR